MLSICISGNATSKESILWINESQYEYRYQYGCDDHTMDMLIRLQLFMVHFQKLLLSYRSHSISENQNVIFSKLPIALDQRESECNFSKLPIALNQRESEYSSKKMLKRPKGFCRLPMQGGEFFGENNFRSLTALQRLLIPDPARCIARALCSF